jgi:glutathione S-transferase
LLANGIYAEGLDFVAKEAGPEGYLVGDGFSVADLTAASLLAITVPLPGTSMRWPEPRAKRARDWHARWADHPGVRWVVNTWERHRGSSAEITT